MYYEGDFMNNYGLLNFKTGELEELGEGVFINKTELDRRKQFKERKEILNSRYKELGGFTWLIFNYCKELFPEMQSQTLSRLLYLSTYINYDGILMKNKDCCITKGNMNELLKLSTQTFYDFYNEMISLGFIKELETGKLLINDDYFFKGKIENVHFDKCLIRLSHGNVRYLYENVKPSKHKQLGYVYKLIPYINKKYNTLCENPLETDINFVKPLSKTEDIAKICNFAPKNHKRLYEGICEVQIDNQPVIKVYQEYLTKKMMIFANPKVYYGGSDYGQVEVLGAF